MTFEEFFKKKKINLSALQQAEPGLFTQFESHYTQMGEKSFDHTKKYWFNKLRRLYPAAAEPKTEKVKFENQLAEQTITETLADEAVLAAPKPAFKPRFKAPAPAKPEEGKEITEPQEPVINQPADDAVPSGEAIPAPAAEAPKPAYKPRFKAPAKSASAEMDKQQPEPETTAASAEQVLPPQPAQAPQPEADAPAAPKPAFKPRFKPGVTKAAAPAATEATPEVNPSEIEKATEESTASTAAAATGTTPPEQAPVTPQSEAPKPAFKPRFKPGLTKPAANPATEPLPETDQSKTTEDTPSNPVNTITAAEVSSTDAAPAPPQEEAPKPAYKPRFSPKMVKPKPPEE